jgi:hypothetical protein
MKKTFMLLILSCVFTTSVFTAFAQGGANKAYTVNNLSPELNEITENVKKEAKLNPDQFTKFKNDYVLFLNENAKPNANTQGLFFLLGMKFRGYMNEAQFATVSKMVKDGKLNPPGTKTDLAAQAAKPPVAPIAFKKPDGGKLPPAVTNQSNVTAIFQQLESFMKISPEKAAQVVPVLKDYDQQLTKIKKDALNGEVVPKLKMHMTDQQIGTLVVALGLQENILSGKNISPDQKLFMDNIRNQYGLNDVQTMSVILVLVQGKIRGDAIGLMSKVNPQQAGQEFIILMQDLDGQLKSSLNNDQYIKVKSDIEKLIKGQKL